MSRLRTDFFVAAYRATCEAAGAYVVFLKRGDDMAGAVYIRILSRDGSLEIYEPVPNMDEPDSRAWMLAMTAARGETEDADAFVARIVKRDPDAWVIDVEAAGENCRPSPVIAM